MAATNFDGALNDVNQVIFQQTNQVKSDVRDVLHQTNINTRISTRKALITTKQALISRNALIAYGVTLVGVGAFLYMQKRKKQNELPVIASRPVEYESDAVYGAT